MAIGKGLQNEINNLQKIILAKTHFFSIDKTINLFFFLNSEPNCAAQSHLDKKYVHRYTFCCILSRAHFVVIRLPLVKIKSLIPCHPPPLKK